jgi:hypothetical protein
MWNWADDTGRGTANVRELAAFAFPDELDPIAPTVIDLPFLLAEVRSRWDVAFYEVGGRLYYAIPSWDNHQRNERKAKSRYPAPEEGFPHDPDPHSGGTSVHLRRSAAEDSARSTEGFDGLLHSPVQPTKTTSPGSHQNGSSGRPSEPRKTAPHQEKSELPSHSVGTSVATHGSSAIGTGEQGNRGTGELTELSLRSSSGAEAPRAAPGPITAQTVTAAWVEAVQANGTEPSGAQKGQVAKAAKELLNRNSPDRVLEAARAAGAKGYVQIDRELTVMNGRANTQKPRVSTTQLRGEEAQALKKKFAQTAAVTELPCWGGTAS